MADIKTLINRKTGKIIYPQTIARAIYDSYGKDLQTRLDELNQNYVATSAQTLTNEQKAQARGNINAAPDGFGLGGNATKIPAGADLNSYVKTGRYAQGTTLTMRQILNLPDAFSNGGIVVDVFAITPTYVMQIAYNLRDDKDIITAMRHNYVGAWQPWEYVNPPMEVNTEYRTTERYLGKPVYTQIRQFDNLATEQTFYVGGNVIRYSGECQWPYDDTKYWIPVLPTRQPNGTVEGDLPNIDFSVSYNAAIRLVVKAESGCLGKSARVQLWYTK